MVLTRVPLFITRLTFSGVTSVCKTKWEEGTREGFTESTLKIDVDLEFCEPALEGLNIILNIMGASILTTAIDNNTGRRIVSIY